MSLFLAITVLALPSHSSQTAVAHHAGVVWGGIRRERSLARIRRAWHVHTVRAHRARLAAQAAASSASAAAVTTAGESADARGTSVAAPQPSGHDWNAVAQCESSGDWTANTGNSFYGGLQFTEQTWLAFGGAAYAPRADLASPADQIAVAERVLAAQGAGAWPNCGSGL